MAKFQIREADLSEPQQQRAIVELIDAYAQIPMIHGKRLTAEVKRELVPGLQRHPTTIVFLAYDQNTAVGVAVCFVGFSTFAARPLINIHDLAVHSICLTSCERRTTVELSGHRMERLRTDEISKNPDNRFHRSNVMLVRHDDQHGRRGDDWPAR